MSGCVTGLTISTLKTMQVKIFNWNILNVGAAGAFIQNLAKERLVARIDPDAWKKRERLIQKPFLLIKTYSKIER